MMLNKFQNIVNSAIFKISPDATNQDILELFKRNKKIVKLDANENPLGPSKNVIKKIKEIKFEISRYLDSSNRILKIAIAERWNIKPENIILGNGSDELLHLVARSFLNQKTTSVSSQYSFLTFKAATIAAGAKPIIVPTKGWRVDLTALYQAITDKTRVIFIDNPSNPTGTFIEKDTLKYFIKKVPSNVIIVIDEAYYEYACSQKNYASATDFITQHPNVVITRTFSKVYGLAGLRIGYAIADPDVVNIIDRVRPSYNINNYAVIAAGASLADQAHVRKSLLICQKGLQQLTNYFHSRKFENIPTATNFLTINFGKQAAYVYQALLQHGILVYPLDGYDMPNHLRITVGLFAENQRLLSVLDQLKLRTH